MPANRLTVPWRLYSLSRAKVANTPGLGRQIWRGRRDGLDAGLLVVRDDRDRLTRFVRFGSRPFQDLNLTIDAQNLGHLSLKFSVAALQIVAHLMRLDFLLAKYLAHRTLDQASETVMASGRPVLARMPRQQPRRPQLVRIAHILGLAAGQVHQPCLGIRRDDRLLARSRSIVERHQRAVSQGSLDTAFNRLMVRTNGVPNRVKRRVLTIGEQHLRPIHPAPSLHSRPGN